MFEATVRDDEGRVIDPRDVPRPSRLSLFAACQLDRFASVLSANVEALEEDNQLELGAHLSSCKATLDWLLCRVASSLAVKDAASPLVQHTDTSGRGEPIMRQLAGQGAPKVSEFLVTELALALSCSERAATDYLAVGLDLRYRLRCTKAEFGGGRITYAHAQVISEATRHLSIEAAEALDAVLADAALTRTPPRLRVLARRKAAAADPSGLRERHQAAMSNRGTAMFSIGDGMGSFCVTTSLTSAATVADQIDGWAAKLRSLLPGVPLDAHRADAATRLLLGQHPITGQSLMTLANSAATPELTPSSKTPHVPGTAAFPSAAAGSGVEPDAPTAGDPAWFPARTELRVTMSADTLLGLDDATCELDGYGPITAAQARQLALQSASVKLRRVFTDPADNSILFLDANTYRFAPDQIACITALHPYSTFPGATTRAARCDIDHLNEYRRVTEPATQQQVREGPQPPMSVDPPGQTVVTNGHPLGRRHHRQKTHGGWKVRSDSDDPHSFHWTSPRGRTYTVNDSDGA